MATGGRIQIGAVVRIPKGCLLTRHVRQPGTRSLKTSDCLGLWRGFSEGAAVYDGRREHGLYTKSPSDIFRILYRTPDTATRQYSMRQPPRDRAVRKEFVVDFVFIAPTWLGGHSTR